MPRRRPRFARQTARGPDLPDAAGVQLSADRPAPPKRRVQLEARHQEQVVNWLRFKKILFFHPANGQIRSPRTGAALKRLGVVRGTPDLWIVDPPPAMPGKVGTVIEMKPPTGGNSGTPEQKAWLVALKDRGWVTAVCKGSDAAISLLESLGY